MEMLKTAVTILVSIGFFYLAFSTIHLERRKEAFLTQQFQYFSRLLRQKKVHFFSENRKVWIKQQQVSFGVDIQGTKTKQKAILVDMKVFPIVNGEPLRKFGLHVSGLGTNIELAMQNAAQDWYREARKSTLQFLHFK